MTPARPRSTAGGLLGRDSGRKGLPAQPGLQTAQHRPKARSLRPGAPRAWHTPCTQRLLATTPRGREAGCKKVAQAFRLSHFPTRKTGRCPEPRRGDASPQAPRYGLAVRSGSADPFRQATAVSRAPMQDRTPNLLPPWCRIPRGRGSSSLWRSESLAAMHGRRGPECRAIRPPAPAKGLPAILDLRTLLDARVAVLSCPGPYASCPFLSGASRMCSCSFSLPYRSLWVVERRETGSRGAPSSRLSRG